MKQGKITREGLRLSLAEFNMAVLLGCLLGSWAIKDSDLVSGDLRTGAKPLGRSPERSRQRPIYAGIFSCVGDLQAHRASPRVSSHQGIF
jgi:hypothetical protein